MQHVVASVNDAIRVAWIALIVTALASLTSQFLQKLSLHGKLCSSSASVANKQPPQATDDQNAKDQVHDCTFWDGCVLMRLCQCFLNWQISKQWFVMFYLLGALLNGFVLVVFFGAELSHTPLAQRVLALLHTKVLTVSTIHEIWATNAMKHDSMAPLQLNLETWWCLFLLELHLVRRFLESLLVTNFTDSTMHATALVLGFGHYVLLSIGIISDPSGLVVTSLSDEQQQFRLGWQGALGLYLFALGSQHQMTCNGILADLKSQRKSSPQAIPEIEKTSNEPQHHNDKSSTVAVRHRHRKSSKFNAKSNSEPCAGRRSIAPIGYGIPQGDWFEYMICPLYTTEIMVYFALLCVTKLTNGTLALATLWVIVNQSISAQRSCDWYQSHFPHAKDRFRWKLVPFVW